MFIVPITPMEKMDFSSTEKVTTAKDVTENAFSSILDSAIESFKEADKLSDIDDIIRDIEKSPNIMFLSDDIKHGINDILTIIGDINDNE